MTATQDTVHGISGGVADGLVAIGVRPVVGHIGAGITQVDIAWPLPAERVDAKLVAGVPFTSKHTVVVAD